MTNPVQRQMTLQACSPPRIAVLRRTRSTISPANIAHNPYTQANELPSKSELDGAESHLLFEQREHGEDGLAIGVVEKRDRPQHCDHLPSIPGVRVSRGHASPGRRAGCRGAPGSTSRRQSSTRVRSCTGALESPARGYWVTCSAVRAGRPEIFAVSLGGSDDFADGFVEQRFVLPAAQSERERQIGGADEQDVDARSRRDLVDALDGAGLLNDGDDDDVAVGGIVIAIGFGPGGLRQSRAASAESDRGIACRPGRRGGRVREWR